MEELQTSNEKEIYNKALAGYLLLVGCKLVDVQRDENGKFVFKFKYTEKTKRSIQIYFGNGKADTKEE